MFYLVVLIRLICTIVFNPPSTIVKATGQQLVSEQRNHINLYNVKYVNNQVRTYQNSCTKEDGFLNMEDQDVDVYGGYKS